MKRYVALIHHEHDTCYGVIFPDFPGCFSAGDSFDEALSNATEALASHVDLMRADGEAIPEPRDLETLRACEESQEDSAEFWIDFKNAIVTMIPLLSPSGKPMRLNISLDEGLLKTIDHVAEIRGMTRSGFLAEAARHAIEGGVRI